MHITEGSYEMDTQVLFYEGALEQVDGTWKLMGSRCACCGYVAYPAKERCPICGGDSTEHVELSSTGTVYSFNIVRVPVGRFKFAVRKAVFMQGCLLRWRSGLSIQTRMATKYWGSIVFPKKKECVHQNE